MGSALRTPVFGFAAHNMENSGKLQSFSYIWNLFQHTFKIGFYTATFRSCTESLIFLSGGVRNDVLLRLTSSAPPPPPPHPRTKKSGYATTLTISIANRMSFLKQSMKFHIDSEYLTGTLINSNTLSIQLKIWEYNNKELKQETNPEINSSRNITKID